MIQEEQMNGRTNLELFGRGDLDLSHSVLAKLLVTCHSYVRL
jgi:hypothetical protein